MEGSILSFQTLVPIGLIEQLVSYHVLKNLPSNVIEIKLCKSIFLLIRSSKIIPGHQWGFHFQYNSASEWHSIPFILEINSFFTSVFTMKNPPQGPQYSICPYFVSTFTPYSLSLSSHSRSDNLRKLRREWSHDKLM